MRDSELEHSNVTLNEVKGTIFSMAPFAPLRMTPGPAHL